MTRIVWFCQIYSIKPNRTLARTALCEDLLYGFVRQGQITWYGAHGTFICTCVCSIKYYFRGEVKNFEIIFLGRSQTLKLTIIDFYVEQDHISRDITLLLLLMIPFFGISGLRFVLHSLLIIRKQSFVTSLCQVMSSANHFEIRKT